MNIYGTTTSSLIFGVQWDAVCVFLENYGKLNDGTEFNSSYLTDETYGKLWGNYSDSMFAMGRGYYNIDSNGYGVFLWLGRKIRKISDSESWLCTTGASEQNSALNIYDFGGNLYEFTLERSSDSYNPVSIRGGGFSSSGYAFDRYGYYTYYSYYSSSARPSLFL